MTKKELYEKLLKEVSEEEKMLLFHGTGLIISDYNRQTMLELLRRPAVNDTDTFSETRIKNLIQITENYLAQYLADKPSAWKWILICCVYLTFICEKPMHPQNLVHYIERKESGNTLYYCPAKSTTGTTTCNFCVCRKLSTPDI